MPEMLTMKLTCSADSGEPQHGESRVFDFMPAGQDLLEPVLTLRNAGAFTVGESYDFSITIDAKKE